MAQQGLCGLQESWVGWTGSRASRTSVLRLSSHRQTRAPSACLGSAELLLWPGQPPRVASTSILLLAHGGRCPQALGPEQGPRTSGSSGPSPCGDRKGVRKPRGKAAAWLPWAGAAGTQGGDGGTQRRELREALEKGRQGGQPQGPVLEQGWPVRRTVSHPELRSDRAAGAWLGNEEVQAGDFSPTEGLSDAPSPGAGVCHHRL